MKILSFEEACAARGYDPALLLPDVSALPEWLQKLVIAKIRLVIIAEAMNEGKQFDWSDYNQRKWFPYFDMDDEDDDSGFGFSSTDYGYWTTFTIVGARLVFFTQEDAEHFGRHFIELHRDVLVVPKQEQEVQGEEN